MVSLSFILTVQAVNVISSEQMYLAEKPGILINIIDNIKNKLGSVYLVYFLSKLFF